MHNNEQLIHQFYESFQSRDYVSMQSAYHPKADFYDPVFQDLSAPQVKAMWQMLVTTAKDLEITCAEVIADEDSGSCTWQAKYTFTLTGRKVHNIIYASFDFKDGKILRHRDRFDLWRWSRMAFGVTGVLMGWSRVFKNKVRKTARGRLKKFMNAPDTVKK